MFFFSQLNKFETCNFKKEKNQDIYWEWPLHKTSRTGKNKNKLRKRRLFFLHMTVAQFKKNYVSPCFMGVNLKSGRYFLNLALLAVFLNWPSDLLVSWTTSPLKSMASTTRSAASLMETSSSSPTENHTQFMEFFFSWNVCPVGSGINTII